MRCRGCGRFATRKFCSGQRYKRCSNDYHNRVRKEATEWEKWRKPRRCKGCGRLFRRRGINHTYCSKQCQHRHWKKRNRRYLAMKTVYYFMRKEVKKWPEQWREGRELLRQNRSLLKNHERNPHPEVRQLLREEFAQQTTSRNSCRLK